MHTPRRAHDTKSCQVSCDASNTRLASRYDGIIFLRPRDLPLAKDPGVEPGRTPLNPAGSEGAHAVEFSKTVAPCREGFSFERTLPTSPRAQGAGPSSLAPFGGGCAARVKPVSLPR